MRGCSLGGKLASVRLRWAFCQFLFANRSLALMIDAGRAMEQTARANILLVEDHDDTARAMARLLNLSGYSVQTAKTVTSAIKLCESSKFDLLISDVGLPDGTGYDLMRAVLNRRCTLKGIAVSGYGSEDDVQLSLSAGFAEHLVKPVAFDTLCEAIMRVIPV
jgi:DNA-binding NtrC family response regulator